MLTVGKDGNDQWIGSGLDNHTSFALVAPYGGGVAEGLDPENDLNEEHADEGDPDALLLVPDSDGTEKQNTGRDGGANGISD